MKPFIAISLSLVTCTTLASTPDLTPTNSGSEFYYQTGGGLPFSLPSVEKTNSISLSAQANLGLQGACGAFNPVTSLTNTLNQMTSEYHNAMQTVIENATAAISELPMYELARANPSLYNLINNGLLGAQHEMDLATKNCQQMQGEIAKGMNPYRDWGTISLDHDWQKQIGLAEASGNANITEAQQTVDQHIGESGVPWVQGKTDSSGQLMAGGNSQPPIQVLTDTVTAGYNALLGRNSNDTSLALTSDDPLLTQVWPTPQEASTWVTDVLGDLTITTCTSADCSKGAKIGLGLSPQMNTCGTNNQSYCVTNLQNKLVALVQGQTPADQTHLTEVSAPGVTVSPQIIQSLKNREPIEQSILINKLAQEIAAQQVMERSLLARQLLLAGSQVPVIAANQPAQQQLETAIKKLDTELQSLAFEKKMRDDMMSQTLAQIIERDTTDNLNTARTSTSPTNSPPLMDDSAVASQTMASGEHS